MQKKEKASGISPDDLSEVDQILEEIQEVITSNAISPCAAIDKGKSESEPAKAFAIRNSRVMTYWGKDTALQQELQAARVHYTRLQKELKAIRKERDSLKLALQIVSKDLYHNSFFMQPDNIRVDKEYQDTQDFILVGKRRRPATKKNTLRQRQTQTGDIRNLRRRHHAY